MAPRSFSLGQLLGGASAACVGLIAIAALCFWQRSATAALAASQRSRQEVARAVEAQVVAELGGAEHVLDTLERALGAGLVTGRDPGALEALLYTELLGAPRLAEVTFTAARLAPTPSAADAPEPDQPELAPDGRLRVSVFWSADDRLATAWTEPQGAGFVERRWSRAAGADGPLHLGEPRTRPSADPTTSVTFQASAAAGQGGRPVWSDLHFSELEPEAAAPPVVLTVQKAVRLPGVFGVARVGLSMAGLDAITARAGAGRDRETHRVALLALSAGNQGPARLVTRVGGYDELRSIDGELRVVPRAPAPSIRALLGSPVLRGLDPDWPAAEAELDVDGEAWLATLSPLSIANAGTRGWLVAVLVPKSHYTRELDALGRALLVPFALTLGLVCAASACALGVIRRGLALLGARTARMRDFDFAAEAGRSGVTDIDEVLVGLERAKTVARAMCKYIPVPLVRRLYEDNRDPELGGAPREVTVMFSDIQGFTSLAERLSPERLAASLGRYLEVMTRVLEAHGATIDKFIGDAVMAFWNAPAPIEQHSLRACRAVLACQRELAALFASPEWGGAPALVTRFGLHRGSVLVGHFGAPTRLSYTALGDGVNLAARLESTCKQYGVTALVSGSVQAEAAGELVFRALDRVTVRGKSQAVDVYELVGSRAEARGVE